MFTGRPGGSAIHIYFSDSLHGNWLAHPANLVVRHVSKTGRTGGRIVELPDGRLLRPAQVRAPHYAAGVNLFEIVTLTTSDYEERLMTPAPFLEGDGSGWNADGMHHIDWFYEDGNWWLAVDGLEKRVAFGWHYQIIGIGTGLFC
jgi:hypothetical protein